MRPSFTSELFHVLPHIASSDLDGYIARRFRPTYRHRLQNQTHGRIRMSLQV
jgi:hypothetical protein